MHWKKVGFLVGGAAVTLFCFAKYFYNKEKQKECEHIAERIETAQASMLQEPEARITRLYQKVSEPFVVPEQYLALANKKEATQLLEGVLRTSLVQENVLEEIKKGKSYLMRIKESDFANQYNLTPEVEQKVKLELEEMVKISDEAIGSIQSNGNSQLLPAAQNYVKRMEEKNGNIFKIILLGWQHYDMMKVYEKHLPEINGYGLGQEYTRLKEHYRTFRAELNEQHADHHAVQCVVTTHFRGMHDEFAAAEAKMRQKAVDYAMVPWAPIGFVCTALYGLLALYALKPRTK